MYNEVMENTDFVIEHIDKEVKVITDRPSSVVNYPANTDFFIENIDDNVISIAHSLNIEASEVEFRPANTDFFIENIDNNVKEISESLELEPSEVTIRPANTDFFVENIDKNLIAIAEYYDLEPSRVVLRPANTDMFIENIDRNVTLIKSKTNVITVSGSSFDVDVPDGGTMQLRQIYGNAEQTTYSGKNKMPMAISDNTSERIQYFKISLPAGTYTISYDISNISLGSSGSFNVWMAVAGGGSGGESIDFDISGTVSSTAAAHKTVTFTTLTDSDVSVNSNIRVTQTSWDNGVRCKLSNIQIEGGSTATAYEPYVGGTASPNPDYPQTVNTVTGEQTVKIEGPEDSQEFPIDLGSLELAKIGTYQDRIYKNEGKWYIEKNVGKLNMADIRWDGLNGAGSPYHIGFAAHYGAENTAISNILTYSAPAWAGNGKFGISSSGSLWMMTGDSTVDAINAPSWLANKNAIMYYALATPTTTEITDETLLDQLNFVADMYEGINNISFIGTSAQGTIEVVINKN